MFSHSLHSQLLKWTSIAIELSKIRIAIAVMLTTGMGYVLASGAFHLQIVFPVLGTFLMACGSAALNQYQERELDVEMARTKNRPIPSGRIQPKSVLAMSLTAILMGGVLLLWGAGVLPLGLALLTFVWYNFIYTPLKTKTAWAVYPGAVIGSLPLFIGWTAASGSLSNYKIWLPALVLFIWQIPHFWLIVLVHDQDYQQSQLPSINKERSHSYIGLQSYIGIWVTILSVVATVFLWNIASLPIWAGVVLSSLWLAVVGVSILKNQERKLARAIFLKLNLYVLWIMTLLCLHSLFPNF